MIKKMLLILIASIGLGGCTLLPPAPFPEVGMCQGDLDCIYKEMDRTRFEVAKATGVQQIKFMEGYEPVSLETLRDLGRLKVTKINPLLATMGIFGYATFEAGMTGDMYSCSMGYSTQWSLLHELRHCQGFWERRPYLWIPNGSFMYTEEQQKIMKEEGVSRWIDTEYYKDEDGTYHWILGD